MADKLSGSEALYGFAGWLTSRKKRTVMSSSDDAAGPATLVAMFCETNQLAEPREEWQRNLTHPVEEKADDVRTT